MTNGNKNIQVVPDLISMVPEIQNLPEDKLYPKKIIPLSGKLITAEDGLIVGHGNFKSLKNLRPALGHPKGIGGITKINTTPLQHVQDYTEFIEVDVGANRAVVTDSDTITVTNLDNDSTEQVYVIKDFGINFFDGNFEHRLKVTWTAGTDGGVGSPHFCYLWGMSNHSDCLGEVITTSQDALSVHLKNGLLYLEEVNGAAATQDYYKSPTPEAFATGTPYYLKIVRDEGVGTYGTLYCYVYSDSAFSTLLDTLSVTLTEKQNFRYLYAMSGFGNYAGGSAFSGTIENLTIPKTIDTLYHFKKEQPTESHLLSHDSDGNIFDNETAIPLHGYTFTVSSASATAGATYTNNGNTFTVFATISGSMVLETTGTGAPAASGTLTKATGTGDATITFSAVVNGNFNADPIWTDTDGAGNPRFSMAPKDHMAYANGVDETCTWAGDEGEVACFFTMSTELTSNPAGILTTAGLAIGTTTTDVSSGAFTYFIKGNEFSKIAVAAGTPPGNDVIPINTYGCVAFDIGTDGTIDAIEATGNATGYASAVLAVEGLPAPATDHARMGYVTAMKSDGAFTFGTTALDAGNTTVAYTSATAAAISYVPKNIKDYTDKVRNTLQDANSVAVIGSGVPSTCKFLLHMDGTDGSTTITDSTGSHTFTCAGTAQLDTAVSWGGTASLLLDGNSDYITSADHADWFLGTNLFTFAFRIRFNALPSGGTSVYGIFNQCQDNDNWVRLDFGLSGSYYYLNFSIEDAGSLTGTTVAIPTTVTTGVWYHVAVIRGWGGDADALALTWEGSLVSVTYDLAGADWPNLTGGATGSAFEIGRSDDGTGAKQYFNGWIDEALFLNNEALWTSNFTPPAEPSRDDNKYGLVGTTKPIQGIKFYVPSGSGNPLSATANFTFKEFIGTSWTTLTPTSDGTTKLSTTGTVAFSSTVNTSKTKYIENRLIYWYQFYLDAGQARVYYVTVDSPFQPIRDTWDGEDRKIVSCLTLATNVYTDHTLAVRDNYYASSDATNYDPATYLNIGNDASITVFLGFSERQRGLILNFIDDYVNDVAASEIILSYSDGQSSTPSVTVPFLTDGTMVGAITCRKSAIVTWEEINEAEEFPISLNNGPPLYYYKLTVDQALAAAGVFLYYVAGIPAPQKIKGYEFPFFAQRRLFLCKENKFLCSGLSSPHIFNGMDSFISEVGGYEKLKAAAELFAQFGNSIYSFIIFLKQSQVWAMVGSTPDEWRVYPISMNVGITAVDTLKVITLPPDNPLNMNKSAIMWLGADNVYVTDGRYPIPVGDDIKDLFDKRSSTYIGAANLPDTSSVWDESNMEYHLVFSTGVEWVFSIKYWGWYEADRGDGNELLCGCEVEDEYGIHYTYGALETGYIERLEYGNDFDGIDITHEFQIGDGPLDQDFSLETSIIHMYLISVAKTVTSNNISLTHYLDTNASGTAYTLTPVKSGYRLIEGVKDVNSIPGVLHSIKGTMVTDNETIGFEPFALIVYYEVIRQHVTE